MIEATLRQKHSGWDRMVVAVTAPKATYVRQANATAYTAADLPTAAELADQTTKRWQHEGHEKYITGPERVTINDKYVGTQVQLNTGSGSGFRAVVQNGWAVTMSSPHPAHDAQRALDQIVINIPH
jgi:hypothetical protein